MGGGGSYYDRDTTDGYATTSRGYSKDAEKNLSQTSMDQGLQPKGRTLVSKAKSPVIYAFDVTGSMGTLPKVIYDKMPLIAGQIVENRYLEDPEVSLAAIGDVRCDQAPIQVCDFSIIKKLDDWLKRIWLEGNGGGNQGESYEFMAYFYARYCETPNAETPFLLITGDEPMRASLSKSELEQRFGGKHEAIDTKDVFDEVRKKFNGNVFGIFCTHGGSGDSGALASWQKAFGKERVVLLNDDKAVADVTLGIFAIMTGSRTLDEYCEDMKTKRDKAQTDDRIAQVREALKQLSAIAPGKRSPQSGKSKKKSAPQKKGSGNKGKKPGRF